MDGSDTIDMHMVIGWATPILLTTIMTIFLSAHSFIHVWSWWCSGLSSYLDTETGDCRFELHPCHLTGHITDRFKTVLLNSVSFVLALMLLAFTTRRMVRLYTYGIVGKARWATSAEMNPSRCTQRCSKYFLIQISIWYQTEQWIDLERLRDELALQHTTISPP